MDLTFKMQYFSYTKQQSSSIMLKVGMLPEPHGPDLGPGEGGGSTVDCQGMADCRCPQAMREGGEKIGRPRGGQSHRSQGSR